MELRQMRYFIKLREHSSIAAAAKTLYITPQALSKSMRALAAELGMELYYHEHGKLCITAYGEVLYEECCALIAAAELMNNRLAQLTTQQCETIRICVSHGLMAASFAEYLLNYNLQYPQVRLELMEMPDLFVEQHVEQERCELGIAIGPPRGWEPFEAILLQKYRLCAVVALTHPFAQRQSIPLCECAAYPLITKNNLFKVHGTVEECAQAQGLTLTYLLQSPNEVLWQILVREGRGVGIGTTFYTPITNSDVRCIPFEDDELCWDVYLIRRRRQYISLPQRILIANLLKQVRQ